MIRIFLLATLLISASLLTSQTSSLVSESDTIENSSKPMVERGLVEGFFHEDAELRMLGKFDSDKLIVMPLYDFSIEAGANAEGHVGGLYSGYGKLGVGLSRRKAKMKINYEGVFSDYGNYLSDFYDSTGVISGFGIARKNDIGYHSHRLTGKLNVNLSEHFSAEIGRSTNFFGNGYRSMVLGDDHLPYPYLKLNTKVWKLNYVNLFMQLQDFRLTNDIKDARKKYAALHALSLDVSESFSVSIFEAVVWQASDTLSTRNFELNYLNPVIFYRPVEFSQGSADNVLLGVSAELKSGKNALYHMQIFLDEFLFDNVTGNTGWWANKVGFQMGVQMVDEKKGLWGYTEYNLVRPFTYTHGSPLQNYGHMNQSLAHPLGNNFMEWANGVQWEKRDWTYLLKFNWALYGRDLEGLNYGGDIFRSSNDVYKTWGNYVGQGNVHHSYYVQAEASRKIKSSKLWVFGSFAWRHVKSRQNMINESLLTVGLRSFPFNLKNKRSSGMQKSFLQDF